MSKKEFETNDIRLKVPASNKEEAIQRSADILIEKEYIKQGYVEEIYSVMEEFGSYFVLAPGIAFAHSKPSQNVLKSGLSIMTLQKPIKFNHSKNDPVFLVTVIASVDSESHLNQLQSIVSFLSKDDNIQLIKEAESDKDIERIVEILNKGD